MHGRRSLVFAGEHYLDLLLFDTIHAGGCAGNVPLLGTAEPPDHVGGRAEATIERRKIMEHTPFCSARNLDINRVAVNLFGKDIYWYGIIICLLCAGGAVEVNRRTQESGVTSDNLMDCLIICGAGRHHQRPHLLCGV